MANPINNVIAIKAAYALLGFLTPFIPFLGIKNLNIKAVFKLCLVASCIAIMYTLWNFREIYLTPHIEIMLGELDLAEQVAEGAKGQVAGYFVLPACLLLMSYRFVPPAYIKIVTIAFILSILSAVAYGRRTAIVYHIVYGLAALYLYLTSQKTKLYKKITIAVSIFIIIYVIILNISDIPLFEFLIERMDPDKFDTRSGVEEFFYNDFVGKIFDWLFGRGIGGTYYCPSGDALYRTVIETGYLQFILNGGIILLGLFLIICLRSFYLGFFKSDNMLNKAMSLFILIQLVFLKGGNPFEFSFRAVLLWVCIVFCNSAKYRHLSNNQIRKIVK
jgi:hypothetical protein